MGPRTAGFERGRVFPGCERQPEEGEWGWDDDEAELQFGADDAGSPATSPPAFRTSSTAAQALPPVAIKSSIIQI